MLCNITLKATTHIFIYLYLFTFSCLTFYLSVNYVFIIYRVLMIDE